jgi:hypothetical protein
MVIEAGVGQWCSPGSIEIMVSIRLRLKSQTAEHKPASAGFNRLEPVWGFPRRRFQSGPVRYR